MFSPGASHLEKMGRELKCPICLSLFKKAASLICNHVFCNECILKSMKSGPGCPVCKVPFARREIRLALHMDSLVNIYQNMEMAAGNNLFVSQPSPSLLTDYSDGQDMENKPLCQNVLKRKSSIQPRGETKKAKGRGHGKHGHKPSQLSLVSSGELRENMRAEKIEQKTPDQPIPSPHQPVKCSFPTKKRVQVSLYPPGSYEKTPLRPGKRVSKSENTIIQNEDDGINEYLLPSNSDEIHIDSDNWTRPMSTGGTDDVNRACKRETERKSKPKSDRILTKEMLSTVSDSVVGCESSKRNPKDPDKELVFTATDIFNAMFGLPTDKAATYNSAEVKSQIGTELEDQRHQYPAGLHVKVQNGDLTDSPINLTPKHQDDVQAINNDGGLGPATLAGTSEMQPQIPGNCCRTEPSTSKDNFFCAFCQTSGNSETAGQMVHYSNGSSVTEQEEMPSNVIHVHKNCAEWAPAVYFKDDCVMNLEAEAARGTKIKCTICGLKGAALGCCLKKCHRSFHVPCALSTPECRWDVDNFVMLCPAHSSRKFPNERGSSTSLNHCSSPSRRERRFVNKGTLLRGDKSPGCRQQADGGSMASQAWTWPLGQQCKWVLCGSALDSTQKEHLNNFARLTGATVSKTWSPTVTHVVASTDVDGACRRTLKFLMSILEGKWVLKIDWIAACMEAGHPVNEEPFEITHDIHGTFEGPKCGRARVEKKAPKLFEGLSFYLSGDFATSSKGYLQELVSAAGGLVLQRKPIMGQPECQSTIVLYNVELPETSKFSDKDKIVRNRLKEARSLANATGAQYTAHTWLLESIAACQLQPMGNGCS